jgi:hypothetical protein
MPMIPYSLLMEILGNREEADGICPLCSPYRKPEHRREKKLHVWRKDDAATFCCAHCEEHGIAFADNVPGWRELPRPPPQRAQKPDIHKEYMEQLAKQLWRESIDSKGTWAEEYVASRGLRLPAYDYLRKRTLRFHPNCNFGPDGERRPAMLAAFTDVRIEPPDDPFDDPPVKAIHRIVGRGKGNKMMLGTVRDKGLGIYRAVQFGEWETVRTVLNVCEGVESALGIYGEGKPVEQQNRPVWALGSKGAMAAMPIIPRLKHLVVWADHDADGMLAARQLANRYADKGIRATVWMQNREGADFAEEE